MALVRGSVLKKRYRILRSLGKGGQGSVYLCEDLDVYRQKRAIKEFLSVQGLAAEEKKMALRMFEQEGAFLAMLDHPGLPRISDKFAVNGIFYLVIDFVQGRNLETMLRENAAAFQEGQVVEMALQLCDILEYMHTRKPPIVFRDLKPENIIIRSDGQVKLIDFGTARFFDKHKKNDTIQVGTVGYAAPEQYEGSTDPRADIYAFGALLHHLLTGLDPKHMSPFEAEKIPVRSIRSELSPHIEKVVAKALKSSRNRRYPDVHAMKLDLLESAFIQVCPVCGRIRQITLGECPNCGSHATAGKKGKQPRTEHSAKDSEVFFLEVVNGRDSQAVLLDRERMSIGRAAGNDIVIQDPSVSARHALLERKRSTYIISDMQSSNGVRVNGRKVDSKKLKIGATLELGRASLVFRQKGKG